MIEIIHQLRKSSGRNKKIEILKEHKDNELWKKYLLAVYHPHKNYYLSGVPDLTFLKPYQYDEGNINIMLHKMGAFSSRMVTGNEAKRLAMSMSKQHGELFRLILKGSINCGLTANTLNKVYGNFIPCFLVMLGKDIPISKFPVWISTKFDGIRLIVKVEDGEATIYTRSGKILELESLRKSMSDQPNGYYDGELVSGNGLVTDRTRITGQVNRILKGSSTEIDGEYTFAIFDRLSLLEWDSMITAWTYKNRYEYMEDNLKNRPHISIVSQYPAKDIGEVTYLFNQLTEESYEGIIARYPEDKYEWKRSDKLIKKKNIRECILTCTDTVEGEGKYKGLIGALKCEGVVEGLPVKTKVGSGLSDFDRDHQPEYYIGQPIEITYNELVRKEGSDTYSLFLPRYNRIVGAL